MVLTIGLGCATLAAKGVVMCYVVLTPKDIDKIKIDHKMTMQNAKTDDKFNSKSWTNRVTTALWEISERILGLDPETSFGRFSEKSVEFLISEDFF